MADQELRSDADPRGETAVGPRDRPQPYRQRARKHMGTATSDPEYLPQTEFQRQCAADPDARQTPIRDARAPQRSKTLRYDRYLQTPRPGRSIFTSPQARRQRHARIIVLIALIAIALVIALVWFLVLR